MERDYQFIKVGEIRKKWKTGTILIRADHDEYTWSLTVGYPEITEEETSELQTGDFQMTFTKLNDTIFLLCRIGKIDWMDAPFEPRIDPDGYRFPQFEPGTGAPLVLQIVDTITGQLKALRVVGMGNVLSNRLHKACQEQLDTRIVLSPDENAYLVNKTYREYPDSASMLRTVNPNNIFMLLKDKDNT